MPELENQLKPSRNSNEFSRNLDIFFRHPLKTNCKFLIFQSLIWKIQIGTIIA